MITGTCCDYSLSFFFLTILKIIESYHQKKQQQQTGDKTIKVFRAPRSLKLPVCNKKSFLKYKSMPVISDICESYINKTKSIEFHNMKYILDMVFFQLHI